MADRTPDSSVLDQDDPSAESSGTEHDPGPDLAEERSGQSPGRPTPEPESADEQDEREPSEGTREPDQPKDAADAPAQEPDEPQDTTGEPATDADEPQDTTGEPATDADEADAGAEQDETPAQGSADDGTPSDEGAEATVGNDGTASDKADKAPTEDEPGEAAAAEASEHTRTVTLRALEDAAGADKTMAVGVADPPRAEPPAPQETQEAQGAEGAQETRDAQDAAPSPLGLLAQLTNTPPPRPTPARTLLRRVRIWSPLVALLVLVALAVQLLRPLPEPTLALDASVSSFTIGGETFTMPWPEEGQAAVMVVGSGTVGTFGEQKPVPTASVAKIMTAYVILREHPLERDEPGPRVTVDARAVKEGMAKDESRIEGLRVGQKFSLQDMLKMLMIPSGNNVARLLARWNTKTEDEAAFVRKMNEAARSLGMKNTMYTDPSGLDEGTVSTAVDQLKLAEAVMRFESFRATVAMAGADIPGVGRIYNNNDRLILAGLSVRGIKTGSNTAAGGTLSWAAYRTVDGEDRLILGSMMDQHATGPDPNGSTSLLLVQDNSKKVIEAVREALTSATAVKKGQVVGHVDDGLGGRTPVVATKDLKAVGTPGQKLTLAFRDGGQNLAGGTEAGTVVGELALGGGAGARRVPVALRSELREPSLGTKLTRTG
ncbi:serine hydrolase [Streptomyces sp. NPDC058625]|uniref:D-alanyl-D-alanine carboxypeptidase n=1 Tax=Streptomyces sp. NPDC058625 TaxID=3346564 RepID=UPI003663D524